MPRYRERKGEKNLFKKNLPEFNINELTSILSLFSEDDFEKFKKIKTKGGKKKVLKGVFQDIRSSSHKSDLIKGLIHEDKQHMNDENFHKGGGLYDGIWTMLDTGANFATSFIKPLGYLQKGMDWMRGYKSVSDMPKSLKNEVDLIDIAAKETRPDTFNGMTIDRTLSNEKVAVYKNEKTKTVYVAVRGTNKENISDLYNDFKIIANEVPDYEMVKNTVEEASKQYGDKYDLNAVGYSLGGTQLTEIFGNKEQNKYLDEYDSILLVNPGASPFNDSEKIENVLKDERTTLLANRSDIISGLYQQYADSSKTFYGDHTYSALRAHDDRQFSTEPEDWSDEKGMNTEDVLSAVKTAE